MKICIKTEISSIKRAVDANERSSGGKIVFKIFSFCENVWEFSPAMKSISSGIDSVLRKTIQRKKVV